MHVCSNFEGAVYCQITFRFCPKIPVYCVIVNSVVGRKMFLGWTRSGNILVTNALCQQMKNWNLLVLGPSCIQSVSHKMPVLWLLYKCPVIRLCVNDNMFAYKIKLHGISCAIVLRLLTDVLAIRWQPAWSASRKTTLNNYKSTWHCSMWRFVLLTSLSKPNKLFRYETSTLW